MRLGPSACSDSSRRLGWWRTCDVFREVPVDSGAEVFHLGYEGRQFHKPEMPSFRSQRSSSSRSYPSSRVIFGTGTRHSIIRSPFLAPSALASACVGKKITATRSFRSECGKRSTAHLSPDPLMSAFGQCVRTNAIALGVIAPAIHHSLSSVPGLGFEKPLHPLPALQSVLYFVFQVFKVLGARFLLQGKVLGRRDCALNVRLRASDERFCALNVRLRAPNESLRAFNPRLRSPNEQHSAFGSVRAAPVSA